MNNTYHEDWRYKQANREALLSLGAYALYFLWWYLCAYGLGDQDPETYTYFFGFPAWFFTSCILGYPLLTVLLWLMIRFGFKNIPLDAEEDTTDPLEAQTTHASQATPHTPQESPITPTQREQA